VAKASVKLFIAIGSVNACLLIIAVSFHARISFYAVNEPLGAGGPRNLSWFTVRAALMTVTGLDYAQLAVV